MDLVMLKYSNSVNHYTALNLTKLDILDGLKEIKVAVGYEVEGVEIESFPADLNILAKCVPVYKTLAGWKEPTTGMTKWNELPTEAKAYIKFIEEFVSVPVKWVGVGPGREHMLFKEEK